MKLVEEKEFLHNFSIVGNDDNLPENLGTFENIDAFQEFFALNTVSEHKQVEAIRYYSDEEIHNFREEILGVIEDELPEAKILLADKEYELSLAKKAKELALESVGALRSKADDLAAEVKDGKTTIEIPSNRTYRVPYKGKYYFYVWQDNGDCVLAKVLDVPEHEKSEIFNNTDKNDLFFENLKNGKDKGKTQQIS